ncbi:MAG: SCO family protein [Alphaproteobacteria bacterium]|nr:SCO family protein [Alphaproteobacteria bacterium]
MAQANNKLGLVATLLGLAAIIYVIQTPPEPSAKKLPETFKQDQASMAAQATTSSSDAIPLSSGPSIGGEFKLTDQDGNPFTDKQLLGKYSLIFFGFTNCPDMCPTALTTLTSALGSLNESTRSNIVPVFITVDPKRDTAPVIKSYLANFDGKFIGLTGDHDAIKKAASSYKVYYESANPEDTDYNVNHSGYIYFMSPDGKYIRHFSFDDEPVEIASEINSVISKSPLEEPSTALPVPSSSAVPAVGETAAPVVIPPASSAPQADTANP